MRGWRDAAGALALVLVAAASTPPVPNDGSRTVLDGLHVAVASDPDLGTVLLGAAVADTTTDSATQTIAVVDAATGPEVRGELRTSPPDPAAPSSGLAVDGAERVWTSDPATGRVLTLDLISGRQRTYATLLDLTPCLVNPRPPCSSTVVDRHPRPTDLAFTTLGDLLVADAAQATVWRIPARGEPEVWTSDPALGGDHAALAVAEGGSAVEVLAGGTLVRIPVDAEGRAGPAQVVWRGPAGPRAAVVTATDGRRWVLDGHGAVVEVDPAGQVAWRRPPGEVTDLAGDDGRLLLLVEGATGTSELVDLPVTVAPVRPARPVVFARPVASASASPGATGGGAGAGRGGVGAWSGLLAVPALGLAWLVRRRRGRYRLEDDAGVGV